MPFPKDAEDRTQKAMPLADPPPAADPLSAAMRSTFDALAQPLTDAANKAVHSQQQAPTTTQASTTAGVNTRYSLDTAVTPDAPSRLLR